MHCPGRREGGGAVARMCACACKFEDFCALHIMYTHGFMCACVLCA